jgi:hypothetical protein
MGAHEDRVFPIKLGAVNLNKKQKIGYEKILQRQQVNKIRRQTMCNPVLLKSRLFKVLIHVIGYLIRVSSTHKI